MSRLLVFLTDPLRAFLEKGEIKPRYYNPEDLFSDVHFISPAAEDIAPAAVQCLVGRARLVIHPLGRRYYATAWFPFGAVARVAAAAAPDVVRAYDPALRGALAVHWARRLGVQAVVSIHADFDEQRRYEPRLSRRARVLFERYTLARADAAICVTRHVQRYAARHGAPRPTVIFNRVDTGRFAPSAAVVERRHASTRPSILTVGRLTPQKYHACLIRALPALDADLTIVGDGPQRQQLESLAGKLDVGNRVTFVGSVPHRDMPEQYAAAAIFAIATHYEGFCIPALEAMAAGLPVVASDIAPLREVVGDAGLLVTNEPSAFASAVQRLAGDPALRATLGDRGRQRALAMDAAAMERREADVYRALMSGR